MNPSVKPLILTPAEELQIVFNNYYGAGVYHVCDNGDGTARIGPENNAIWTYRIADALMALTPPVDSDALAVARIPMKRVTFQVDVTVDIPANVRNPGIVHFDLKATPLVHGDPVCGARVIEYETKGFYTSRSDD